MTQGNKTEYLTAHLASLRSQYKQLEIAMKAMKSGSKKRGEAYRVFVALKENIENIEKELNLNTDG